MMPRLGYRQTCRGDGGSGAARQHPRHPHGRDDMTDLPEIFIFTDVAKANAEVSRLYRATAISGAAIVTLLEMMPDDKFPAAKQIADDLCAKLDAISAEREQETSQCRMM
jgi:hypothetical protein